MKINKNKVLETACGYFNLGFSVIPVGVDKKPLIEWKQYQNECATFQQIEKWMEMFPEMNIGIVTGKISNLIVVDIEAGGKTDGLPSTVIAKTGGGGWHYYYKHPGVEVKNATRIRELTDIRGDGGYVVAPPSLHPSGNSYEWLVPFGKIALADLPTWVFAEKQTTVFTKDWPAIANGVNKGSRNTDAASFVGKILHDLSTELWTTTGWDATVAWNQRNNPPMSEKELRAVFESIKQRQSISRNEKPRKSSRAMSECFANIKPEPISWLWPEYMAIGKITLIAGDPGLGKSLITSMLAATVSKGYKWPINNFNSPLGSVIMLSAEDDPADTIRPRLDAAGTDCARVHIIKSIEDIDATGSVTNRIFSFKRDIVALEECLSSLPDCKLVIIDPVSAYLDGTDGNSNSDIRGLFTPLAGLASKYKVAVVLVQHLNKSSGGSALYRPMGSLAFIATARAAFIVTKDPDNPHRRMFMPAKNNLAKENIGLAYSIMTAENGSPVIAWESEPISITADEALAIPQFNEERTATDDAVNFLKNLLLAGPVSAAEADKQARQLGIGNKPLRSARGKLGIKPIKTGFSGGWVWALPQDALKAQEAHPFNEGNLETRGHLGQSEPLKI